MTGTCIEVVQPLSEKCLPEWNIDWHKDVRVDLILPSRGVIFGGNHPLTVPGLIEFLGCLWNAESPLEMIGHVCRDLGPHIYAFPHQQGEHEQKNTFKRACDKVVSMLKHRSKADFYQYCRDVSNTSLLEQNIQRKIISNLTIAESCTRPSFDNVYLNTSNIFCSLIVIGVHNVLDLATTTSRVIFNVLEWLGPSPFSGDVFGACAGLALIGNMNIDDIITELKSMASYFVANGLMYFKDFDGCDVAEKDFVQFLDDTLFYGHTGGICGFLSGKPSRKKYRNMALEITDSVLPFPKTKDQCVSLINWVVKKFPYIENSLSYVTLYDISTPHGRIMLCNQVIKSLTSSNQYTPKKYKFPDDLDIDSWYSFDVPVERLLGFNFTNAMDLLGAILNSATVIDGANVLCTVLESVEISESLTYPTRLCTAFKIRNTKSIETTCREIAVPLQYGQCQITSIRPPTIAYAIVVGIDVARKLLKLNEISVNELCRSIEKFYKSDNNLRSIFELTLSAYYASLLPVIKEICNDYDDFIHYIRQKSLLSYKKCTKLVDASSDLISTLLGFSNSKDLCRKIADETFGSTGHPNDETILYFVDETLRFLTDERRCADSIAAASPLIHTIDPSLNELLEFLTGYKNKAHFCKDVASSFSDEFGGEYCFSHLFLCIAK